MGINIGTGEGIGIGMGVGIDMGIHAVLEIIFEKYLTKCQVISFFKLTSPIFI